MKSFFRKRPILLDSILSLVVGGAAAAALTLSSSGDAAVRALYGDRSAVYGNLASIFGALLGFTITAISVVIGLSSDERLVEVRDSPYYQQLWNIFFAATRSLAAATAVTAGALFFDRATTPSRAWLAAVVIAAFWAATKVWRVTWILERVVRILVKRARIAAVTRADLAARTDTTRDLEH